MSELAKLETKALDIAKEVKAGFEEAGDDAVKLAAFVQANQSKISALAALAGPEASQVVAVGFALTNLAITAVKNSSSAAAANGVNVSLDSATVGSVKSLITAIEKI